MRKIKYGVYHCTASHKNATVEGIKRYWKEEKKWKSPGYHVLILRDGTPVILAHISQITNGVLGYNEECVHMSYIGGIEDKWIDTNNNGIEDADDEFIHESVDNRTFEQIQTQIFFGKALKAKYPRIIFKGHRDFKGVKKDCPCFDVESDLLPYIEDEDQEDLFMYDGVIEHPFFKLIEDIKKKKSEGLNDYEKSLYDAFIELTE